MEDARIIELYWLRSEEAVARTAEKYGRYCAAIARRFLPDPRDGEEAVADTWTAAWDSIPPRRPNCLQAYLGRITRNLCLDRIRAGDRLKRGGGEVPLALEELEECLPGPDSPEREAEQRELAERIDRFLRTLPETERQIFVERYWYMARIEEIARAHGFSKAKTTRQLHRTRKKLGRLLEKEELL